MSYFSTAHVFMGNPKNHYATSVRGNVTQIRDYFLGQRFEITEQEIDVCIGLHVRLAEGGDHFFGEITEEGLAFFGLEDVYDLVERL